MTGDGRVVVLDSFNTVDGNDKPHLAKPYDLPLSLVLGNMPKKTFTFTSPVKNLRPLVLPVNVTVKDAYDRVARLLDVGSKRFLTNKVDRSVTGLVAQQQCVGPLSMPLVCRRYYRKPNIAYYRVTLRGIVL